jgi:hypothetical protein
MKQDRSVPHLSPVIAAARRRPVRRGEGGGGYGKTKNNYVAEKSLSAGRNSGNRKGAGAPAGNFNASTLRGIPELHHLRERTRAFFRRAKIITAFARAARLAGDHPDKRFAELVARLHDEGLS